MKKIYIAGIITLGLGIILSSISIAGIVSKNNSGESMQSLYNKKNNITSVEKEFNSDDFENIEIDFSSFSSDFSIKSSDDDTVYMNAENISEKNFICEIKDNTLYISSNKNKSWKDKITINLGLFSFGNTNSSIEILLPKSVYNNISLNSCTGDIDVENLNCKEIKINSDTGNITLDNVQSKTNFDIESNTGNINLSNIKSEKTSSVINETGEMIISDSEIENLSLEGDTSNFISNNVTYTGNLNCTIDTGEIQMQNADISCNADISDDTGNINIELFNNKDDYDINILTDIGDSTIDSEDTNSLVSDNPKYSLVIESDLGDVDINFLNQNG